MQEVESKFASFCCALACNSQLNVRSYVYEYLGSGNTDRGYALKLDGK